MFSHIVVGAPAARPSAHRHAAGVGGRARGEWRGERVGDRATVLPIEPPITFASDDVGEDPEPMGSDRFALLLARCGAEQRTASAGTPRFIRPGRRATKERVMRSHEEPIRPLHVPRHMPG